MKKIIFCFLLCCLTFVYLPWAEATSVLKTEKVKDALGPADFSLLTVSGKTVKLSEYRGEKDVILFFFTTWCPFCVKKLPDLIAKREKYKAEGIEVLFIDVGESVRKVRSFAVKRKITADILLDSKMKTARDFDVIGVPTFVLVSKQGSVVSKDYKIPKDYKLYFE